jgi:hypothetical protein
LYYSRQASALQKSRTGQNWLERALFFWYHHSAMGHFLSAQMTETKLIRKLAPKHFFYVKN